MNWIQYDSEGLLLRHRQWDERSVFCNRCTPSVLYRLPAFFRLVSCHLSWSRVVSVLFLGWCAWSAYYFCVIHFDCKWGIYVPVVIIFIDIVLIFVTVTCIVCFYPPCDTCTSIGYFCTKSHPQILVFGVVPSKAFWCCSVQGLLVSFRPSWAAFYFAFLVFSFSFCSVLMVMCVSM